MVGTAGKAPARDAPFLDLNGTARRGPMHRDRLSPAQIEHVRRTVRRTPEVMVKVTGGGRTVTGVRAHVAYISHGGDAHLEDDQDLLVEGKAAQKALVKEWNLDLTSGQYRPPKGTGRSVRPVKLVHNIVLSMPAPTPPTKVLAAVKHFAREQFGTRHRYAMVLHTHQQHPHVHLVVKAEREDGRGRLRIDKAKLREWREAFAQAMREQGVPANATPRAWRGQKKRAALDRAYWLEKNGRSALLSRRNREVVAELRATKTIRDPARAKLVETRKAVLAGWEGVAKALDDQGEIVLAGDVRYFAKRLPPVLTDRERLAVELIERTRRAAGKSPREDRMRDRERERTR